MKVSPPVSVILTNRTALLLLIAESWCTSDHGIYPRKTIVNGTPKIPIKQEL